MSYSEKSYTYMTDQLSEFRKSGSFKNVKVWLSEKAKPYLQKALADAKGSEKKLLEHSHNLVLSFLEGASTGDVDMDDVKTLRSDLIAAQRAHVARVAKAEKADTVHKDRRDLDEYQPAPDKYDPGEGAKEVYEKYSKWANTLQKNAKSFTAERMPVVVLTPGVPDQAKLRKTGLSDDLLFGYPVLKNQILIGFNSTYLNQYRKGYKKYEKEVKNNLPITTSLDVDWESVNDFMARELRERFGRDFVMMGPAHKHGNLFWIWMADSRELKRLNGTTGTQTFSVSDWTLPFPKDMKGVTPKKAR